MKTGIILLLVLALLLAFLMLMSGCVSEGAQEEAGAGGQQSGEAPEGDFMMVGEPPPDGSPQGGNLVVCQGGECVSDSGPAPARKQSAEKR